jgi:hypothetical protein
LDPTTPNGTVLKVEPMIFDPIGEPITLVNHEVNMGWEHVWHCHILAHEEMDMMRTIAIAVPPRAPSGISAVEQGPDAYITWTDNSASDTGFTIQRAEDAGFTVNVVEFTVGANAVYYLDTTIQNNMNYYYRVRADNTVGDTWDYNDPNINEGAVGFPHITVSSDWSNTATLAT